jgi:hypothetical protein
VAVSRGFQPLNTPLTVEDREYTDGNAGNQPHQVAGIGNVDRQIYFGSAEDLRQKMALDVS